jgi:hypothetical protein
MTTVAGSAVAMGSISTIPAPMRLRRLVAPVDPVWRDRVVSLDTSTRPDTRPDPVVTRPPRPEANLAGARPQVSQ